MGFEPTPTDVDYNALGSGIVLESGALNRSATRPDIHAYRLLSTKRIGPSQFIHKIMTLCIDNECITFWGIMIHKSLNWGNLTLIFALFFVAKYSIPYILGWRLPARGDVHVALQQQRAELWPRDGARPRPLHSRRPRIHARVLSDGGQPQGMSWFISRILSDLWEADSICRLKTDLKNQKRH